MLKRGGSIEKLGIMAINQIAIGFQTYYIVMEERPESQTLEFPSNNFQWRSLG